MHRNAWKSGKTSERSMEHINVTFQVLTLYYSFLRCFHCGKLGEGYTSLCILLLLCSVTLYLFQNKSFKGKKNQYCSLIICSFVPKSVRPSEYSILAYNHLVQTPKKEACFLPFSLPFPLRQNFLLRLALKKNLRNRFLSLSFHYNSTEIRPYPSLSVLTTDPNPIPLCTTFQPQNSSSKIHYSFHIYDFDQTAPSCRNILSSLLSSILLSTI